MSRFLSKKVSPAKRWNPKGVTNVRSSSPRKLYSTFADQLGAKAHSMPAPSSQPLLLLVQARIAEIMRAGAERAEVTVEQVVRELKLIGFSDIRKVVSWRNELVTRTEKGEDGAPVKVLMPRVTIVDADKISDEAAAAVAEVSQTVNGALRVKLHDKHAALVSIGKHLGMFVDRVQIQERKQISAEPMSAEEWKRQYVREG